MTSHQVLISRLPAKRVPVVLQMSEANLTVGSMILTDRGERLVEDLKPGDFVITKNLGRQKVRYVTFQDVNLITNPKSSPIKISGGHFGFDRDTFFHPSQQISVRHPMFDMMFGSPEVLLSCSDLRDQPGFTQVTGLKYLTYVALGFSYHHIVICNGAPIDVGPTNQKHSRMSLGSQEARLAVQLLVPKDFSPKRHSFPFH